MNVVITGGSKGIGRAIALAFAGEGAAVAICARGRKELDETAGELRRVNPDARHIAFPADCSRREELIAFFEKARENFGDVDVLVNNAGVYREATLLEEPEGLLEETLELNLLAAYHGARFFSGGMKTRKSGHIFNICSVASLRPVVAAGSYTISKYALLGLSKTLREELKPFGVKVTSVIPGSTLTASWEGVPVDASRFATAADVASAIVGAFRLSVHSTIEELLITPTM
ncbi:short-subunit dehydrogenase [Anseongella ginsenosidimutans]|uniref:Short-subunit dehydrogenase n=1 Tax=Anseongella ginsenosidimutans TaxID=496056 RepID=A0A4R3KPV8_9SPHI|nr:SDR family oxidoreductase [Anseongella ginsenosidimutans]QEC53873.1 SDR family oxidoreductase [Anseongella ginsenosidimutans]TCS86255.1 short-subunit dehydrogenase [Anseongella ginsenosidimutans]